MDKMIDVTSKRFPDVEISSEKTHGISIPEKCQSFFGSGPLLKKTKHDPRSKYKEEF